MSNQTEEFNFGQPVTQHRDFTEQDIEEIKQVLHKYDGDFTADEIDAGLAGDPVETIVIVNGEIVEHIINSAEGDN
jgi:DNA-binding transcriptional MerR regulator